MSADTLSSLHPDGYELPVSLWSLIEEYVCHVHEQQEVKRILGESLVDQSIELHDEVCTLLSIWEEVRVNTSHRKCGLPEPPHVRDRLIQEICFFVENVREKAQQQGLDAERLFSGHNRSVIGYAADVSRGASSMSQRSQSSLSTLGSSEGKASEDMQSFGDKLNYLQLDDVVHNLRKHLQDEVEKRLSDITFLQKCLDNEMQLQANPHLLHTREPSLAELKEERAALEKELLAPDTGLSVTPPTHKVVFDPPLSCKKSTAVVGLSQNLQKRGSSSGVLPVKAVHDMCCMSPPQASTTDQSTLGYRAQSQVSLQDITVLEKLPRRRTVSPSRVKVVSVGNIISPDRADSSCAFVPSPPPQILPPRPSSADRFRQRVLQCRDPS